MARQPEGAYWQWLIRLIINGEAYLEYDETEQYGADFIVPTRVGTAKDDSVEVESLGAKDAYALGYAMAMANNDR